MELNRNYKEEKVKLKEREKGEKRGGREKLGEQVNSKSISILKMLKKDPSKFGFSIFIGTINSVIQNYINILSLRFIWIPNLC